MAFTRPRAAQINFDLTNISDPLIRINSAESGDNTNDLGIVFERGNHTNAAIVWDESADAFRMISTTHDASTTTTDINISAHHSLHVGGLGLTGNIDMGGNDITNTDLLRINQTGTGLRMTNVGAFDNDGSDNFRIFSTGDLQLKANGDSGGGLTIDATNQDVTISNDLRVSAGQFYYGGTAVTSTAAELNYLDGVTGITLGSANELLVVGTDGSSIASDSTLAVDTANNRLGINQTSPEVTLHMTGEDSQTAQIRMEQYNNSGDAPDIRTRRYRGTVASPLAVNSGDYLFRSNHEYWNGTELLIGGAFAFDNTNNAARTQFSVAVDTDGTGADPAGNNGQFKIDGNDSGAITFNNAYKFPTADGSADQVLATNGSGTLSFVDAGGGGGHTIQNAGAGLTARTNLNFDGTYLVATDDSGNDQTDVTINATSANTASTIVARDGSGNFTAGTINATNVDISGALDIGTEVVLTESTDRSDLLLIKSTTSGWGGLQISNSSDEGLWSFMTDGSTGGIYDDQNGDWAIQFIENSEVRLYHNGSEKLNTTSGGVTITGVMSGTATSARYADLAEKYTTDADYEPGTVLIFGGEEEVTLCTKKYDRRIAGIVSVDPAYLMNNDLQNASTVALVGRVPCKVVGFIRKGDLMVSSDTDGHAEAWRDESSPPYGTVIGKSLENKDSRGTGVVEVVVGAR
jgi:hypothetical protein